MRARQAADPGQKIACVRGRDAEVAQEGPKRNQHVSHCGLLPATGERPGSSCQMLDRQLCGPIKPFAV